MAYTYHPPTRKKCKVCEYLSKKNIHQALINTYDGRSSSSNGYPFHNWYNFVLGYTPSFPEYMLRKENIKANDNKTVLDPFNGSGTTQLVCKLNRITSYGIDANDYMVFASKQKLKWDIDTNILIRAKDNILRRYNQKIVGIDWNNQDVIKQLADIVRPKGLDIRYISDKPLLKIDFLKQCINEIEEDNLKDLLTFALTAILVPVSNVKYGPGFGVTKPKDDVDVLNVFCEKLDLIINDLNSVNNLQKNTISETIVGDSRRLSDYYAPNSIDLMITSPPYPGDHEYTKHSKLELIFQGYANDLLSFRIIKKRMIRGSTTNIYKEDCEKEKVENIFEIRAVTDLIDKRLKEDGATSGFEKLYTKLIWEYFGGMANTLDECFKVLKPGGKIALLVSDSHAFKMVHIQTAEILKIIGEQLGYINSEVILWQMKKSTSHSYELRENILILQKPKSISEAQLKLF